MEDFEYINKTLGRVFKSNEEINWNALSAFQPLTEEFIEKFQDKVNWRCISSYQSLSEPFIEKHADKVDWHYVSTSQKLSENFIEEHINVVYLEGITTYQKLSENFIQKHKDILSPTLLIKYQKAPQDIIDEINFVININNLWQYKDENFKKDKVIKTKLYECYDNYFIAYKAIRPDRYSIYNFQYQYLPGKTYESNCDCTKEENSFGLNVGTYDYAKRYLGNNQGIIVKCKVYYKDIGRIVHDGNKVRCFKITVLE